MKTILVKQNGKTIRQFNVSDLELNLAKKLGLSSQQYIVERTKVELDSAKELTMEDLKSGNWRFD
jgi:hypothetical protein